MLSDATATWRWLECGKMAAASGRADILELLLDAAGPTLDGACALALLHTTVKRRQGACLKVLTPRVDVDGLNKEGKTAVFVAVEDVWEDGVVALLDAGANVAMLNGRPNQTTPEPCPSSGPSRPIEQRSRRNRRGRRKKPATDRVDGRHVEPVRSSQKTVLQLVVGMKGSPDCTPTLVNIFTAIINAARRDDQYKEIINVRDDNQMTPLFIATLTMNLAFVKILLNAGADVTLRDKHARNVLHCAATRGDPHLMEALCKWDPPATRLLLSQRCQGQFEGTPLLVAVHRGHCASVKYLIEKSGASVRDEAKLSPRDCASVPDPKISSHGSLDDVSISLSSVSSAADRATYNVLHLASRSGKADVIEYFTARLYKKSGADLHGLVSRPTEGGFTPLHLALTRQQTEFVYALLAAGSDLTAECRDPRTGTVRTAMDLLIYQVPSSVEVLANVLDRAIKKHKVLPRVVVDYAVFMPARWTRGDNDDAVRERTAERTGAGGSNGKVQPRKAEVFLDIVQDGDNERLRENSLKAVEPELNGHVQISEPLLAKSSRSPDGTHSFAVLHELQKSGNWLGQRRLLEHPLVESYLYLHWRRLQTPYLLLVAFTAAFAASLSALVFCDRVVDVAAARLPSAALVTLFAAPLALQEAQCLAKPRPPAFWCELLAKLVCFALAFWLCCFAAAPPECAAFAVLLAWFELVLLVARVPHHGHYMFMFVEIAFKYLKLLLAFMFVIVGFALAFMVTFRMRPPFHSPLPAVVKTLVMMSNEYEYEAMFNDIHAAHVSEVNGTLATRERLSTFSQISAMAVFVMFVVLVGLVLTNLFVGVAVNDITKMHVISKRIEFLALYEQLLLATPAFGARGVALCLSNALRRLLRRVHPRRGEELEHYAHIKRAYTIHVCNSEDFVGSSAGHDDVKGPGEAIVAIPTKISHEGPIFPDALNCAIVVKGYENRERINEMFKAAVDEALREKKADDERREEERQSVERYKMAREEKDREMKQMEMTLASMRREISEILRLVGTNMQRDTLETVPVQ